MDKVIPISDLQSQAKKYVDQVKDTDQPVVITQRGRAAAVLISYETFERARKESQQGKRVTLDAYVKRRARR